MPGFCCGWSTVSLNAHWEKMFLLLDEKDVHLMGQCCPIHSLMVDYKEINATRIVGFSGSFLSYVISTMSHLVLKPVCSIQVYRRSSNFIFAFKSFSQNFGTTL
jgi:hypothetical protein